MRTNRIVVFGVTGSEKCKTLKRFASWCSRYRSHQYKVIDFEGDFLFNLNNGGRRWYTFLDDDESEQRRRWNRAWERLCDELKPNHQQEQDLIISVHGCFVRGHYGVRCILEPRRIAELHPDRIVTLLENVHDMYWRTQERAEGLPYRGTPTLEQLLFARRVEMIVADQTAYAAGDVPHLVLAVRHPCETLWNWLQSKDCRVVYLGFPISAPRDLDQIADPSGMDEINGFLRKAYQAQHDNPDLVLVCPLAIDELPLVECIPDSKDKEKGPSEKNESEAISFNREELQWDMNFVWPYSDSLSPGPPASERRTPIQLEQLDGAAGMIRTDVGWRDYRLVAQSDYLAVFNPKFKNRPDVSRSVLREIRYAKCPVFYYQDPAHDPQNTLARHFSKPGTMGPEPKEQMIIPCDSVEAMFRSVAVERK